MSLNIQVEKINYRSDLKTTILAYLPSKSSNFKAIDLFLQKFSNLIIVTSTISTRTDFTLQTGVKELRAIMMCSAFIPHCGYCNSTINLIGDVYCPNTKCSGKLCLHKKTLQSFSRSDYQCPKCASVCHVRNISWKPIKFLFLSFGQGVYILEESPKSIQDVIRDVYRPGK